MNIEKFNLGELKTNSYIVYNDCDAIIVDLAHGITSIAKKFIEERNLTLRAVIITHAHYDHIFDFPAFSFDSFFNDIPIYAHRFSHDWMFSKENFDLAGLNVDISKLRKDINWLDDGALLNLLDSNFKILHTPGHSPDGIVILNEEHNFAFSGDTIFFRTVGRTDFFASNHDDLINSIQNKIYTLRGDLTLYPGHGKKTTVEYEKLNNYIIKGI